MNKLFYPKLALSNIKKNSQIYIPYIFASIFTIAMYYIMIVLSDSPSLTNMGGGRTLAKVLGLGATLIGFFSILILFYANSFLMKQRKKELGVYNILGMEKKHLSLMLLMETLWIFIFSTVIGIVSGLFLSKLLSIILMEILGQENSMQLTYSNESIMQTCILFLIIFFVIFIYNGMNVQKMNSIDLLKEGQQGEREPKIKWLFSFIGFGALGAGYYSAQSIQNPMEAIPMFFVAVVLVIVGTYLLFISGSILILKLLRKNKKIYYHRHHFTTISGMLYRMKQHAIGLATICILSTMVLVTISTTASFYFGKEAMLSEQLPQDFRITNNQPSEESIPLIEQIVGEELENHNLLVKDKVSYQIETSVIAGENGSFAVDSFDEGKNLYAISFISVNEYNQITGGNYSLENNEVLIYSDLKDMQEKIEINGHSLNIIETIEGSNEFNVFRHNLDIVVLVVSDLTVVQNLSLDTSVMHYLGFDVSGENDEGVINEFINSVQVRLDQLDLWILFQSYQQLNISFMMMYGGVFFLGFFLGALFLMATGLIIYYKQISEGYEDKERFNIMQKVGMSKDEVKITIRVQTLLVFFLPLIVAVIHIAFSFRMIRMIMNLLGLTNTLIFLITTGITVLIFAIIYMILYQLTVRIYYNIVN